jgi:ABC-2 type transport system ATP-binding protein
MSVHGEKFVISARSVGKEYRLKVSGNSKSNWISNFIFPKFKRKIALSDFNLDLGESSCLAILGPNGAGKTTLIKILCGIQSADNGSVLVLGRDPYKRGADFYKKIGVVLGHKSSLWWDLPVIESFKFCRSIYEIENNKYKKNLKELTENLRLEALLSQSVRTLSLGERVKVELACALLHGPELLFLDEPTIGLDVMAKSELRQHINHVKNKYKVSIVLTSHDVGDVEACCDEVVILNRGKIEMKMMFSDLKKISKNYMIFTVFSKINRYSKEICCDLLSSIEGITYSEENGALSVFVPVDKVNYMKDIFNEMRSVVYALRPVTMEEWLVDYFKKNKNI